MFGGSAMIGKRVLVDIEQYHPDGALRIKENFVGVFVGVGERGGNSVLRFQQTGVEGVTEIPGVLEDLRATERTRRHPFRRTGGTLDQLDFVVEWKGCDEVDGDSTSGVVTLDP